MPPTKTHTSSQEKYFDVFEKGLLSDLDRKTIEPIALTLLGEKEEESNSFSASILFG